jgi:hypothetical protein
VFTVAEKKGKMPGLAIKKHNTYNLSHPVNAELMNKPYSCFNNRRGEAKEMKKALLCDTLSSTAMAHRRKQECTDCEVAVR